MSFDTFVVVVVVVVVFVLQPVRCFRSMVSLFFVLSPRKHSFFFVFRSCSPCLITSFCAPRHRHFSFSCAPRCTYIVPGTYQHLVQEGSRRPRGECFLYVLRAPFTSEPVRHEHRGINLEVYNMVYPGSVFLGFIVFFAHISLV